MRRALLAAMLVSLGAAAQPVDPMAGVVAQGAPHDGAAVAARFPAPSRVDDSPALAPGATAFTSNAALADLLTALSTWAPPGTRIERLSPGLSQRGTALEALHFSRGRGRPLVLLIGQQHGDEPAGAEALLAIARALARGELAGVLDRIDVTVLPRLNPDGAESQQRAGAGGIDINRDHLLLRAPESRALAALLRRQRPAVVVDAHEYPLQGRYLEKFGAVQRADLLLQYATTANLPPRMVRASDDWFRQPIIAALAAEGLTSDWYHTSPATAGDLRLFMGGAPPDTSRNTSGLRNAVSLLLESRGAGLGRQHLARRVHSQVVAIAAVLRQAAAHAEGLVELQAGADAEVMAAACGGRMVVQAQTTPGRRELLMLDPLTGADKRVDVAWQSALTLRALTERPRPCGYWLAAGARPAAETLQALGLRVRRFEQAAPLSTESWFETARAELVVADHPRRSAGAPGTVLQLAVETRAEPAEAPAGSYYVSLEQPLANLVVAALEPDSQASYVANRLVIRLDAVRRVMLRPAGGLAPF